MRGLELHRGAPGPSPARLRRVGLSPLAGRGGCARLAAPDALAPLGARITDTPITPERVLRALGKVS